MHEASIPADATNLKRGNQMLPMTKTVATSDYPPLIVGDGILCGDDRPFGCEAQRDEAPDCDQELARQGDDRDAAGSTLKRANTVSEPCREAALRLVAKPKPGELDERFAGWHILLSRHDSFDAPGNTRKEFATIVARKN